MILNKTMMFDKTTQFGKTLNDIPPDTILHVLSFVNEVDIKTLYKSTKYFRMIITHHTKLIIKQLYNKICIPKQPIDAMEDTYQFYKFYKNFHILFHLYSKMPPINNCDCIIDPKFDIKDKVSKEFIKPYLMNIRDIYYKIDKDDRKVLHLCLIDTFNIFFIEFIKRNDLEVNLFSNCKDRNTPGHKYCFNCLNTKCIMVREMIHQCDPEYVNPLTKYISLMITIFDNVFKKP